jgi:hypothetical protein
MTNDAEGSDEVLAICLACGNVVLWEAFRWEAGPSCPSCDVYLYRPRGKNIDAAKAMYKLCGPDGLDPKMFREPEVRSALDLRAIREGTLDIRETAREAWKAWRAAARKK